MPVFFLLLGAWFTTLASAESWHCPTGYCLERKYLGDTASSFSCTRYVNMWPGHCAFEKQGKCFCDGFTKFGDEDTESWTDEIESNGTGIACTSSAYGSDPKRGSFKTCKCRPKDGLADQPTEDTKDVAVMNADTDTDLYQGYDFNNEVACVNWNLMIDVPAFAASMVQKAHVRMIGAHIVRHFLSDPSPVFYNVTLGPPVSTMTPVSTMIRVESSSTASAKDLDGSIMNLNMETMKSWAKDMLSQMGETTISAALGMMDFKRASMTEPPAQESETSASASAAFICSFQLVALLAWSSYWVCTGRTRCHAT